jgi:hypothetical protein
VVPGGAYRARAGLVVHRGLLNCDETGVADGVPVTSPIRSALDLACANPLTEAVVALDALSRRHAFAPGAVIDLGRCHLGARGSAQLGTVVRLADPLAESPMESRIRLAIVLDGLPTAVLQHPIGPFFLDMAFPVVRVGVEYDGEAHRSQRRAMRDLDRRPTSPTRAGRSSASPLRR